MTASSLMQVRLLAVRLYIRMLVRLRPTQRLCCFLRQKAELTVVTLLHDTYFSVPFNLWRTLLPFFLL